MTEIRELSEFHGVYGIRNIKTGKMYVGVTRNLETRWKMHRYLLRNGRHTEDALQDAWSIDGESSFELVLIEKVNGYMPNFGLGITLREAERTWLLKLSQRDILYNKTIPKAPDEVRTTTWRE